MSQPPLSPANSWSVAQVGKTDVHVTRLGFGAAAIANLYATVSEAEAIASIQTAFAKGLNFFDTAPYYGLGESEARLGQALGGVPRDQYILETKFGKTLASERIGSGLTVMDWEKEVTFDFSRDAILRSLEHSLRRLKTDRIDIALLHDPENAEHYRAALDSGFPTLVDLRSQGVIQAIGAGMNEWQTLSKFADQVEADCFLLAGRYTLLEQTAIEFLAKCQAKNISVFLGGVFNSGVLAHGAQAGAKYNYTDAPAEILGRVRQLELVCQRHQVPLKAAALQFAAAHPAVAALIIGMDSSAQVLENLELSQWLIPAALWADLQADGLIASAAPVPHKRPGNNPVISWKETT